MTAIQNIQLGQIDRSRVRGLLFDVDGTLSDTDDQLVGRLVKIISPLGLLFEDRDVRPLARRLVMAMESPGNFVYNLADRLGFDNFYTKLFRSNPRRRNSAKIRKGRFLLIPGVQEMLTSLQSQFKLAVVSARDADSTFAFLEHFDLLQYFDVIVTGQTCQRTKPFPDPVNYAAESLGLTPDICVMIGDTVVDIKAGKAAEAQTVAVLCGFGTLREIKRVAPDLIISTTPDLTQLLLSDCRNPSFS